MDNKEPKKPRPAKRRRAKNTNGTFKANDPSTSVDDAWEPDEAPLKDYKIKPKVSTTTDGKSTVGKYGKKRLIRPTFGKISTTEH
tara:strand:+ start:17202 stop:17456 length:255 start_codon:yes stop_codon:yes gene_type:complete